MLKQTLTSGKITKNTNTSEETLNNEILIKDLSSTYEGILYLGKQGETGGRKFIFDFSKWKEKYGQGTIDLYVRRHEDSYSYPVLLTIENNKATWTITETDVEKAGDGHVELKYSVNDIKIKSITFNTRVFSSISTTIAQPPEPYHSWIDTLVELGDKVQVFAYSAEQSSIEAKDSELAAKQSEESALISEENALQYSIDAEESAEEALESSQTAHQSELSAKQSEENAAQYAEYAAQYAEYADNASQRYPYINTENKNWMVWDVSEGQYVDTGIQAEGEAGTSDHSQLENRDADDQHPMSAITGLVDALVSKLEEESDPTVPLWAKEETKPSYSADEISDNGSTVAAEISSINGKISSSATSTNKMLSESEVDNKFTTTPLVKQITLTYNGDTVTILRKYLNIKTGASTEDTETVNLATSSVAGLMSPASVQAIADLVDRVSSLEGTTVRLLYSAGENPTSSQIEAFVRSKGYTDSTKWAGIAVVVKGIYHIWHYYSTDGWTDDGVDTVSQWTNNTFGIIKGSLIDGQIYAEDDGTGSVNGWSALKNRVANTEEKLAPLDASDAEDGTALIVVDGELKQVEGYGYSVDSLTELDSFQVEVAPTYDSIADEITDSMSQDKEYSFYLDDLLIGTVHYLYTGEYGDVYGDGDTEETSTVTCVFETGHFNLSFNAFRVQHPNLGGTLHCYVSENETKPINKDLLKKTYHISIELDGETNEWSCTDTGGATASEINELLQNGIEVELEVHCDSWEGSYFTAEPDMYWDGYPSDDFVIFSKHHKAEFDTTNIAEYFSFDVGDEGIDINYSYVESGLIPDAAGDASIEENSALIKLNGQWTAAPGYGHLAIESGEDYPSWNIDYDPDVDSGTLSFDIPSDEVLSSDGKYKMYYGDRLLGDMFVEGDVSDSTTWRVIYGPVGEDIPAVDFTISKTESAGMHAVSVAIWNSGDFDSADTFHLTEVVSDAKPIKKELTKKIFSISVTDGENAGELVRTDSENITSSDIYEYIEAGYDVELSVDYDGWKITAAINEDSSPDSSYVSFVYHYIEPNGSVALVLSHVHISFMEDEFTGSFALANIPCDTNGNYNLVEEWTFTLDDNTTVTKKVAAWTSAE